MDPIKNVYKIKNKGFNFFLVFLLQNIYRDKKYINKKALFYCFEKKKCQFFHLFINKSVFMNKAN